MSEGASKQSLETEPKGSKKLQAWHPLETLRREVDHLFEDFDRNSWRSPFRGSLFAIEPFWRRELSWGATPAIDIVDKDKVYEVTAELPGLDENNIDVKLANGGITIKGEKKDLKEEKEKDYYLHERHYGSFERFFRVPEDVDTDKIEARYSKGVLTLTLPKKPQAQKPEKKIEVKAAS